MIDPGMLNRRLILEAPVDTPDGQGGFARSFVAVSTVWASVTPLGARDAFEADARGINAGHRITIRRNAAVTPRHRLRDGAAIFHITGLREDASRQFLHIDAFRRID